jgi:hypothetical protein
LPQKYINSELEQNSVEYYLDILVDDSPKNYTKWVEAGRDEKSYILFDRPYNQDCPATNRIYKLSDLINLLKN